MKREKEREKERERRRERREREREKEREASCMSLVNNLCWMDNREVSPRLMTIERSSRRSIGLGVTRAAFRDNRKRRIFKS